jgi:translation initiation factor 3 subunit L
LKKNEQMYALLAICLSLCPHPKLVEENVNNLLREKYAEKMLRMQRSEEATFDELFSFSCPKFITPSLPNYNEPLVNFNQVCSTCKLCGKPLFFSSHLRFL